MKYLYVAIVIVLIFSVGSVTANECSNCGSSAGQGAGVVSQEREIVTDKNEPMSDEKESGVNNEREMPQSQTHDKNSGLPNVVPSDKTGEI